MLSVKKCRKSLKVRKRAQRAREVKMPVEKVFTPGRVSETNPKNAKEQKSVADEEETSWSRMAKEAKGQLDYANTQKMLQQIAGGGGGQGLQVEGKVNLGEFNFQEQAKQAQEAAEKIRTDYEARVDAAKQEAEETKAQLHEERLNTLRNEISGKFGEMNQTMQEFIKSNKRDEKPLLERFTDEFNTVKQMVTELGLHNPQEGGDANLQIQLARMEMDRAKADRDFKREMKNDERRWQLELRKLDEQRDYNQGQLRLQAQRNEFFANVPQQIGAAFAQATLDRQDGQGQQRRVQGQSQRVNPQHRPPAVSANVGESGSFACPYCEQQGIESAVAVGPTASVAQCPSCNARFPIQRVQSQAQSQAQSQSGSEEEEE
jgi:hypothetical protein